MYTEIEGDLVALAKQGLFDVICHGCNCFCTQKAGIAVAMVEAFETHQAPLEDLYYKGDINKLGQIDYFLPEGYEEKLTVINAYTQYNYGGNRPLDYEALALCMRKINHIFKGKHIGLPMIGAGLAGGHWPTIQGIIERELKDMTITVVKYKP